LGVMKGRPEKTKNEKNKASPQSMQALMDEHNTAKKFTGSISCTVMRNRLGCEVAQQA
jgi:hypothetical protein